MDRAPFVEDGAGWCEIVGCVLRELAWPPGWVVGSVEGGDIGKMVPDVPSRPVELVMGAEVPVIIALVRESAEEVAVSVGVVE